MKRKKGSVCVLLCMSMLLFAGCKTRPYDLSQEDQRKVADYAAHVVTKYNGKQEEGYLKVNLEEMEQGQAQEEEKKEEKKEDKAQTKQSKNGQGEKKQEEKKQEVFSLKQALKLGEGLDASYKKYEITDSYVEEGYFAMTAAGGKNYLVVHIDLESEEAEMDCDMLSKNLEYRILINGDQQITAQTTILLNDLGTFQGKIQKDAPQDCVLLFEAEASVLENIESLQLKVLDAASTIIVNLQ